MSIGVQGRALGPQAKLVSTEWDLVHISVGVSVRWHVPVGTTVGGRV